MLEIRKQLGGAEKEADELREVILNLPDIEPHGGKTYYVSEHGSDENDGLSPQRPIRSFANVNSLPLRASDTVLFERNSVFREPIQLFLRGGVYYGAYGEGSKPFILGSQRDYAEASLWNETDKNAIWRLSLKTEEPASLINFNFDTKVGQRYFKIEDLNKDGDFFHDTSDGSFYLYYSKGNPGAQFDNIEIATARDLVYSANVNHVTISNLAFKYATFGPFAFGNNKEIILSGLEISWVGGRLYTKRDDDYILYGNALEFWYRAYDITVKNCYISQVFDAAITFQGYGGERSEFVNIDFSGNLIEYCSMNIEFWAGNPNDQNEELPFISHISIKNNLIRFGGYGWGGILRPDKGNQALILGWNRKYEKLNDFVISENIFDCADCNMIFTKSPDEQDGLTVLNNSYYQKEPSGRNTYTEIVRGIISNPKNQADLEKAVADFEKSPNKVVWIS